MSAIAVPEAASVLLVRGNGSSEIYIVRRADNLRFFGGFHAFPGGRVDAEDIALAQCWPGLTGAHVAAIRELFEEVGVLLARSAQGGFLAGSDELTVLRRDLLENRLSFADLLARKDLTPHADDLVPGGCLVTPPFSPIRFDTRFFVAAAPAGQEPEIWPGELAFGEWLTAPAILESWTRGERLVSPPTVTLLQAIRDRPALELADALRPMLESLAAGDLPPIAFAPDVDMLPLRCRGLPPSTHTNAFLIGRDPAYLLDPSAAELEERARLFSWLDRRFAAGRRLAGVVLSHHHPDHFAAAEACAERYGVPILAHRETARLLAGKVRVTNLMADGDLLDLGRTAGGAPWAMEAILTPGHAPGHLAFYDNVYRFVFAGDMVSTLSSVVIAPPEGDLAAYLGSLRRLQRLPARLLLPAHGAPTARVAKTLADCLEHRRLREEQLVAALGPAPQSIDALTRALYRGLPSGLAHLAELQTLAGLRKLESEGRAIGDGTNWRGSSQTTP